MKTLTLLLALLMAPASLLAQGVFVPPQTAAKNINGVLMPIANATITVCAINAGGVPCAPPLINAIFKDSGLSQPLSNPFTADANGNYQFAASSATYTVTVTAAGFAGYSYQVSLGGSGSANSGTATNVAYYALTGTAVSSTDAITFPGGGIAAVKNGMTIGGGSSACGSATNCQSVATSAGSVTPTAGQNTLRFFGGNLMASINNGAEGVVGGSGGGNPVLENCSSDQTGNTFYNVNSLTNYFYGAWAFVFNTATYITCTVFIPSAQAGATLVLDIAANDSTAGHTANFQTCDQVINSGTINIGAPTCAANQTFTTTATAYNRVTLTFNVQSTLANNSILVVKIATSTTGTPPTANMLVYPHFIL